MSKFCGGVLIAAFLGLVPCQEANAWIGCCGPQCQGAVCYVERLVTCYRRECRIDYQDVKCTIYKCVTETKPQEVRETVFKQVVREVDRQKTVFVPTTREETRERVVLRCNWKEERRERTIMVPETKEVERKVTVLVPVCKEVKRTETVMVPVETEETRQRKVVLSCGPLSTLTMKDGSVIAGVVISQDEKSMTLQTADGQRAVPRADVELVTCTAEPLTRVETFKVRVCRYQPQKREVTVLVPSCKEEIRTQKVLVCSYRTEKKPITVRVPVITEEKQPFKVKICEYKPEVRTYKDRIIECVPETRSRQVMVTTYKMVPEVVTQKVGCVRCVDVPYQAKVLVPACCK